MSESLSSLKNYAECCCHGQFTPVMSQKRFLVLVVTAEEGRWDEMLSVVGGWSCSIVQGHPSDLRTYLCFWVKAYNKVCLCALALAYEID
jgi:hypothetical protein